MKISERLSEWGYWKNNYVVGIGYKSETIESKIQSKTIFGTGCYGTKVGPVSSGASFIENVRAEEIDLSIRRLKKKYLVEMELLHCHYVKYQSVKELAVVGLKSRSAISKLLIRAETLVEGACCSVSALE